MTGCRFQACHADPGIRALAVPSALPRRRDVLGIAAALPARRLDRPRAHGWRTRSDVYQWLKEAGVPSRRAVAEREQQDDPDVLPPAQEPVLVQRQISSAEERRPPSFGPPPRRSASRASRRKHLPDRVPPRRWRMSHLPAQNFPIHGRLPLRKGFRRGWHSGLGCCHPFGLNDHRSLASMRSAGRLPIIFSGSWPWESDGLRRPRSDRSCHPQRSPSQLVEAFQGRIDLIRPKPSIDLPENALAPPSSARLTPPHGRSRHDSAGPRGSVPACSRPRPRRR